MKVIGLILSILLVGMLKAQTTGTVTDYDGNTYSTVKIGNQWWMAENLRTSHYYNGTAISQLSATKTSSADDFKDYYSYPNNDASNAADYGLLYSWGVIANQTATVRKQLLPDGWCVPDTSDWAELAKYLGGKELAGGKLKRTDIWTSPNTSATDEAGFHAIPAGDCNTGGFTTFGTQARFWTPQLVDAGQAGRIYMFLANNSAAIQKGQYRNVNTLSLRLILKSTVSETSCLTNSAIRIYASSTHELVLEQVPLNSRIQLFSNSGQLLKGITNTDNEVIKIQLSSLTKGIYLVTISNKGLQLQHKIIQL